jgi:hypothetical protein
MHPMFEVRMVGFQSCFGGLCAFTKVKVLLEVQGLRFLMKKEMKTNKKNVGKLRKHSVFI